LVTPTGAPYYVLQNTAAVETGYPGASTWFGDTPAANSDWVQSNGSGGPLQGYQGPFTQIVWAYVFVTGPNAWAAQPNQATIGFIIDNNPNVQGAVNGVYAATNGAPTYFESLLCLSVPPGGGGVDVFYTTDYYYIPNPGLALVATITKNGWYGFAATYSRDPTGTGTAILTQQVIDVNGNVLGSNTQSPANTPSQSLFGTDEQTLNWQPGQNGFMNNVLAIADVQSYLGAPGAPPVTTINLGYATVGTPVENYGTYATGNQIVLAQASYLESFSFALTGQNVAVEFAIFDSTGPNSGPGVLLYSVSGTISASDSFATLPMATPPSLPAGTYWICELNPAGAITAYSGGSGKACWWAAGAAFVTKPSANVFSGAYSLYATFSSAVVISSLPPNGTIFNRAGLVQTFESNFAGPAAPVSDGFTLVAPNQFINHTPWDGDFGYAPSNINNVSIVKEPLLDGESVLQLSVNGTQGGPWTGAILCTTDSTGKGFSQAGGVFEARMKLPSGQGLWPAFWLDSAAGPNPVVGATSEIDVIEAYTEWTNSYWATVHKWLGGTDTNTNNGFNITPPASPCDGNYHTYTVEITPTYGVLFYMDDVQVAAFQGDITVMGPMSMLLDLEVGGAGLAAASCNGFTIPSHLNCAWMRAWHR
jgi:hypothetical protein